MEKNNLRVLSNFIVQALRGEDLTISGDGSQTRSFCYQSDLIETILRLMELETHVSPIDVWYPKEVAVVDLARPIHEAAQPKSATVRL